MEKDFLTNAEKAALKLRHRSEKDGKTRDRIKAVLLRICRQEEPVDVKRRTLLSVVVQVFFFGSIHLPIMSVPVRQDIVRKSYAFVDN
ncbi:MAG: hypothetical protein LBJ89_01920 [Holosporales bacterium]|jgi:hypothetical protein|nr:hypothetical protein [Holosporales bacterium]